ncbi:MAG TPA: translation initiation factor IF-2 subunit beta [Acidilobales archaeon]|nr:translation initiation factor IF-2 subunit beta [Acidilobales archaeon]
MSGKGDVLDYEWLLDRLYSKLPSKTPTQQTLDIPSLNIVHVGLQTHIKNFKEVCDVILREPRICARYLLKELAARGSIDDSGVFIIYSRVSTQTINTLFKRFLDMYVRCSTCGSYQTELKKRGKIWIIRCLACGAETPVKPI